MPEVETQSDSAKGSDASHNWVSPNGHEACGSCETRIVGEGRKCEQCHFFHYCQSCFQDADKLHPGHTFIPVVSSHPGEPPAQGGGYVFSETSSGKKMGREKTAEIHLHWEVKISKLVEATQRGCLFSMFFLEKVFVNVKMEALDSYRLDRLLDKGVRDVHERIEIVEHAMQLLSSQPHDRFVFAAQPVCRKAGTRLPDFDKNDPAGQLFSSRRPTRSPASSDSMAVIKEWTETCDKHHGHTCLADAGKIPPLPTRVIDISGEKLRLRESRPNEKGQYIALSYCWGGVQEFQTTRSTIQSRLAGFPPATLPRTLQDAVTVARNLDIQFLWVDSICIVQDDPRDMVHEISKMAQIYKHAYLTINAARARSAKEGFLNYPMKNWPDFTPLRYRIPSKNATSFEDAWSLADHTMGTLWLPYERDDTRVQLPTDPVSRPGWCLQEQVLSPRLLSYGRWPTWRCQNETHSDGGFYTHPDFSTDVNTTSLINRLTQMILYLPDAQPALGGPNLLTAWQLHRGWQVLVKGYSRRELGKSSDKLPAIGGIAAEISRVTGARYLAGLWANSLLEDMMWATAVKEWACRPSEWRAPTWSWASVDCPVSYDD
ncbi:heterokaryon incompatibility protein-domain-containing protein [Aspergillus carlsbadensis]|nr:heterokaryon incompatibility protein-domain-containing protein [Aspergillus carlsbadensis]